MSILSQNTLIKITAWLAAEIILNLIGIDDLADYGEFIRESKLHLCSIATVQQNLGKQNIHSIHLPEIVNNIKFTI
jgi:hypothetical protein